MSKKMELRIEAVHGHGNADEEFVLIEVVGDCDLSHFMVGDTTYTAERKISNKVRHVHWFKPKKVKAGDRVELRTGRGKNKSAAQPDGGKWHIIHWKLDEPMWNDEGDGAILFAIKNWRTTPVAGE